MMIALHAGIHPQLPLGLTLRNYQGEQDLPAMLEVFRSCSSTGHDVDHDDTVITSIGDITQKYSRTDRCDPRQDVLIAEASGQVIAYARVTWWQLETGDTRIYFVGWYIRPEWVGKGLEAVFLGMGQERARQIIRQQESEAGFHGTRLFEAHAMDSQPEQARMLAARGFQAVRWASIMTCPDLQPIPEAPMPAGLAILPARPEHNRPVWEALLDVFRDDPGYSEPDEDDYARWQQGALFQPELWQIAWEADRAGGGGIVAGLALNCIIPAAGAGGTPTAWTEDLGVRLPWRRRGLARALLARSMTMFREMGFRQASLGVELNNPHGARQLYESLGYRLESVLTIYQKPVDG